MDSTEALRACSRAAYERGRLRLGLVHASPVPLLALLSLVGSQERGLTATIAAIAFASIALAVRHGGSFGAGAKMGFLFGLAPFAASLATRGLGHLDIGGGCVHACTIVCGIVSVTVMLALLQIARYQSDATHYALAGGWTMLTVGATACACVGVVGVTLLVATVAVVAFPLAVLWPRPSRAT